MYTCFSVQFFSLNHSCQTVFTKLCAEVTSRQKFSHTHWQKREVSTKANEWEKKYSHTNAQTTRKIPIKCIRELAMLFLCLRLWKGKRNKNKKDILILLKISWTISNKLITFWIVCKLIILIVIIRILMLIIIILFVHSHEKSFFPNDSIHAR